MFACVALHAANKSYFVFIINRRKSHKILLAPGLDIRRSSSPQPFSANGVLNFVRKPQIDLM